jgi:hypothetical protein
MENGRQEEPELKGTASPYINRIDLSSGGRHGARGSSERYTDEVPNRKATNRS